MIFALATLVATLIVILAARKSRRRYGPNDVKIPLNAAQVLGTLGDNTVLKIAMFGGNLTEDLFIKAIKGTWTIRGLTATEGPLSFGIAHSDYTVAEIAEALDAGSLLGPASKIEGERARRLVRKIGTFSGAATEETVNNGNPVYTRVGWTQQDGADVNLWVQNQSGATLTTGATLEFLGDLYGKWLV